MNILAVDCAVSRLSIALKYEDKMISQTLNIGMRQSEMLVPTIDEILNKMGIKASDLDATALTIGPGSFTGLRLGISALKAIELAFNIPVYGISSLDCYAYPFSDCNTAVLSCIDANKDKFYASIPNILKEDDWEIEKIADAVKGLDKVIITGPDADKLFELLKALCPSTNFIKVKTHFDTAEALIEITEKMIDEKKEPLKDYDGPIYLRASEAEIKLNSRQ
ncbi:MAG: tRNA (adenosine(37)-N6)-threonylcarbamoyltransferase complex dimerization subunit type 1 TsaB [Treponema sp.]|nr:tRNA (adenosine(37)-N6)-threonylcarbamoyltransferase complex dimerization subunit type 1 TsaB [Treponema sp.]